MPSPPRPLDATLHGVVDYTMGALLITAFPKLAGIQGTRSARQIRLAGAIHAGYSALTDYPLGVVKALPYKAHLALDAIGRRRARRDAVRHRAVPEGHAAVAAPRGLCLSSWRRS